MRMMLLRNGMLMVNDPNVREEFVAIRFSIDIIDTRSLQELVNFGMKSSFKLGQREAKEC